MKRRIVLTLGLYALVAGVVGTGCKKKNIDEVDLAYHHSPEGVHEKIQEQRMILSQAFSSNQFIYIHDQMYYVQGLVDALASKLEGDKKQRLEPVLKDLSRLCDEVHDAAGKRNTALTERKLQEFYDTLKLLEPEFPPPKKKK